MDERNTVEASCHTPLGDSSPTYGLHEGALAALAPDASASQTPAALSSGSADSVSGCVDGLPTWCVDLADDGGGSGSDSDSCEDECHICRLTADEMGEALVVPCACVSLPVHPSCCASQAAHSVSAPAHRRVCVVESWRVQCRNPDSAIHCPTCRQRYKIPISGILEAPTGDDQQRMVSVRNAVRGSRGAVYAQRAIHRSGGLTFLPPHDYGVPAARTAAIFACASAAVWILATPVFWLGEHEYADELQLNTGMASLALAGARPPKLTILSLTHQVSMARP